MENETRFIGYKIQLYPNKQQIEKIKGYFGACRFAYNFGIEHIESFYAQNKKFISAYTLRNLFNQYKHKIGWLKEYDSGILALSVLHSHDSYKKFMDFSFFRKPKFKSRKNISQSIPVRSERLVIHKNSIRISESIGWIKCGPFPNNNIIGNGNKYIKHKIDQYKHYYNSYLKFDGCNFWLSFSMEESVEDGIVSSGITKLNKNHYETKSENNTIGIDLGFSKNNWIVDSNNNRISIPDFSKEYKKIKHIQRKINRQNNIGSRTKNHIGCKSKRYEKTIAELNKYHKRIVNKKYSIMMDYITHQIINHKPKSVVIEDLRVSEIIKKNEHLPVKHKARFNKKILNAGIYKFQTRLQYKCENAGIKLIKAISSFPSTQRCSNCGSFQKMGKKRIYRCPNCGMVKDRDLNAAINLSNYYTPIKFY